MKNFKSEFAKYAEITAGDLSANQKEYLKKYLSEIKPDDLNDTEDHIDFLKMLRLLRTAMIRDLELVGKNFIKTLESLLSVGSDGVYSSSLRFIYELIQNVDDCEYVDSQNCKLDVRFDTGNDVIELFYNEEGFTPENVFAITGIAEGTKNISADKVEIGEKGIGFKSVFGIAESVHIQSGLFSFKLHRGNFIVPIPCYDNFTKINGTKLTLQLSPMTVYGIYQEIVKQYSQPSVLLNKNPILFLNKLTHVRFFVDDSFRYLKFHVSRITPRAIGSMEFEEDVLVSVDIADPNKQPIENSIRCYRYRMPIMYDRGACVSRYSEDTEFQYKRHYLVAVFPRESELQKTGKKGALYSFLPTQVKMSVPLLLHVPYKLDISREHIDPQCENRWFCYTNEQLGAFLKFVYSDLATRVKTAIVGYLPRKSEYFFSLDNEKTNCLKKDCFCGRVLRDQKLFFTADNTFEKAGDVVSFRPNEMVDDPISVYLLLSPNKKLFLPNDSVDIASYGVEVIEDAYGKLFRKAIGDLTTTGEALPILASKTDFDFEKAVDELGTYLLSADQIIEISKHEHILTAFQNCAIKQIKKRMRPTFRLSSDLPLLDNSAAEIIREAICDTDFGKDGEGLLVYLKLISSNYAILPIAEEDVFFPCENTLVLSNTESINSFASFTEKFVGKSFAAPLRMRQESENLNIAVSDEKMSNDEYLKLLIRVRRSLITILTDKGYSNYIHIINKSGSDPKRFVNELLQNADDCNYSITQEPPNFLCTFNDHELTTSYNEDGFSKANVRSITAIGESTKKQLQSANPSETIGEKGVGFKSVFGVASEVAIHSNGFHFRLTDKEPTVPRKTENIKCPIGTKMIFKLKQPIFDSSFTEEGAVALCLCLRKLKRITIDSITVEIEDSDTRRTIYVNGEKYNFTKFEYSFVVNDDYAISERENKQRKIARNQSIYFYIPVDKITKDRIKKYNLYCGLPTSIQLNIPLIIDAPFENTTSRDGIIHGLWNSIIRKEVYNALIAMLHRIKAKERIGVFEYVKGQGIFSDTWLNDYQLKERVSNEALVPLFDGSFVATNQNECWLYPDFCRYMFLNDMASLPKQNIVDAWKYIETLIWIGCRKVSIHDLIDAVAEAVQHGHMSNMDFRKQLYASLKANAQSLRQDSRCQTVLNNLKIIPVKPKQGGTLLFVAPSEKIYSAPEEFSQDKYYLLNEAMLTPRDFYEVFGKPILPMDDSQKEKLYKDMVVNWLNGPDKQQVAERLLGEYERNRSMFALCKYELKGRISQVPMLFCNGEYCTGNKFISNSGIDFFGEIVSGLVVAPKYKGLAIFLDCSSILNIHYDDIDVTIRELTADDVEDFLHGGFEHKIEILQGFIDDNKIPREILEQYNLEGIDTRKPIATAYDFPTNPVTDLQSLRRRIASANLNRIIMKEVTEQRRIPDFPYDKTSYALRTYSCDDSIHVCQMCREFVPRKYIEINAIEYEPQCAWEQMQLCLCLECSKDFESLRRNDEFRNHFLRSLVESNIDEEEPIAVPIGTRELFFTSTHLAEVQEIIKRQRAL